jgi:hypothetical protein
MLQKDAKVYYSKVKNKSYNSVFNHFSQIIGIVYHDFNLFSSVFSYTKFNETKLQHCLLIKYH